MTMIRGSDGERPGTRPPSGEPLSEVNAEPGYSRRPDYAAVMAQEMVLPNAALMAWKTFNHWWLLSHTLQRIT